MVVRTASQPSLLILVPLVLVVVVSLAAALGLAPLAPGWSGLAWVAFFVSLLATAALLYQGRPGART